MFSTKAEYLLDQITSKREHGCLGESTLEIHVPDLVVSLRCVQIGSSGCVAAPELDQVSDDR